MSQYSCNQDIFDLQVRVVAMSTAALVGVCLAVITSVLLLVLSVYHCYRRRYKASFFHGGTAEKGNRTFYARPASKPISSPELSSPDSLHGKGMPTLGPSKTFPPGTLSPVSPLSHEKKALMKTYSASTGGVSGGMDPGTFNKDCYSEGGELKNESGWQGDNKLQGSSTEDLTHLGQITFTVEYRTDKGVFTVTIHQAQGLPVKDPQSGTSDPYIKLCLLPEKKHKVKTRVMRKTLEPVYEETFTFYGLAYNQLQGVTLHFVVMSFDRFSRDDVIGEVVVPLANIDLSEKAVTLTREVKPRHPKISKSQGRGELLTSLCYQPAANKLTVVVLKAKNLPKMDVTGLSDPYVKIYLMYNNGRLAKKKTRLKKRTLNPVFNESFLFDVPLEGLENVSLEFQVLDHDRVMKNEIIGRLVIGKEAGENEAQHWADIMRNPRKQMAEWHKLTD
ncbi:synaptotagmin-4-like [Patiria miniata]|uniref:C2 domain-containing protein n=1 Tax=Patiria miniata TaxID=46514 RepID=A0A914B811_PATMI|nr:synaptotagmin-4-like [Patiria miniata]